MIDSQRVLFMDEFESTLRGPYPVLKLPCPPKTLHPNKLPYSKQGSMKRSHDKKKYRNACEAVVREYIKANFDHNPCFFDAVISLTFVFGVDKRGGKKRHKQDPDNLIAWCKNAIDALTLGGLLSDDREVIYLPPRQAFTRNPSDALEVVLWEGRLTYPPFIGG